ncbi:MAG: TIGR04282 family arsenosugar biosynthesis glycosyltransferase [Thermodesulfovibrionales bacterium]|nr:TIGR04282 family arsenosugar biosynthesis glycosyltransferase [Thermodesulfovibrionales bacterium]
MKNNPCLALFFKVPTLGKVKTRLASEIGEEKALRIYTQMLDDTVKKATKLNYVDVCGFYGGEDYSHNLPFICYMQEGRDLGERIVNAFNKLFGIGYHKVCIIGSDSPTLPDKYIYSAFRMLDKVDVVIGPTIDGGYYLIGLKTLYHQLFEDISWGSKLVFDETLKNIHSLRLTYHILPKWFDIDELSDLKMWLNSQNTESQVLDS